MKNLVIGDPHIRVQDIEEGWRLVERVKEVRDAERVTSITIMGDLFHTHSIMHVDVMHFWRQALRALAGSCLVTIILGNHDGPQEMRPGVHALAALEMPGVTIADCPVQMGPVWAVPFMRDNDEFVRVMNGEQLCDRQVVYCHQEFNGCKYDNGFYSKVGVDPEAVPQKLIISGHIHSGQEFGKVWYVGAPRWMTASDANQDRFIWVIEHDNADGTVLSRKPFPTDPACVRMIHFEDRENVPQPEGLPPGCKALVDIIGSAGYVEERKRFWQGRARVRTFVTDERQLVVKESDGIPVAFKKYMNSYEPKYGVPKFLLEQVAHDRLGI